MWYIGIKSLCCLVIPFPLTNNIAIINVKWVGYTQREAEWIPAITCLKFSGTLDARWSHSTIRPQVGKHVHFNYIAKRKGEKGRREEHLKQSPFHQMSSLLLLALLKDSVTWVNMGAYVRLAKRDGCKQENGKSEEGCTVLATLHCGISQHSGRGLQLWPV